MKPSNTKPVRARFAKVLKAQRKSLALTQEELAGRAGLAVQYISMLERDIRQPTITTVFELSRALELSASEFIRLVEDET